ncbi:hypothetical protein [Carnobacterium sp. TMP28]|uniref:hypothetical protein n=1 Tax=Carnobacterium sp. TMP28 TaxID=3397060 RepID=UPI0039DFAC0E
MACYTFGMLSKKTVEIDQDTLFIKGTITNQVALNLADIKAAYIVAASLTRNGTVYFSTTGKDAPNATLAKEGFIYTKKQLKDVHSLLAESGIKAIYSDHTMEPF